VSRVVHLSNHVGEEVKGVDYMKDEELKLEEIEASHKKGGKRFRCYERRRYKV
jgi:hypothetical protein